MPRLHRNNAAEWVMVIALWPVAWVVRGWRKRRGRIAADRANRECDGVQRFGQNGCIGSTNGEGCRYVAELLNVGLSTLLPGASLNVLKMGNVPLFRRRQAADDCGDLFATTVKALEVGPNGR